MKENNGIIEERNIEIYIKEVKFEMEREWIILKGWIDGLVWGSRGKNMDLKLITLTII